MYTASIIKGNVRSAHDVKQNMRNNILNLDPNLVDVQKKMNASLAKTIPECSVPDGIR